jgi:hypothetical protein
MSRTKGQERKEVAHNAIPWSVKTHESRPRATVARGLETSFAHKAILVRDALAQTLFQMAEPRRAVYL